jgi:hypothetical protein
VGRHKRWHDPLLSLAAHHSLNDAYKLIGLASIRSGVFAPARDGEGSGGGEEWSFLTCLHLCTMPTIRYIYLFTQQNYSRPSSVRGVSMDNLAATYRKQGQCEEAEQLEVIYLKLVRPSLGSIIQTRRRARTTLRLFESSGYHGRGLCPGSAVSPWRRPANSCWK